MPSTKEQLRRLMELDKFFQKGRQWKAAELLRKLANESDIQISERTLKDDLAYLNTESDGILINRKIGREWFWYYTDGAYSHFKKSLLPAEFADLQKMILAFKDWGDLPFWHEIELMMNQFETRFAFDNQPGRRLIEFQKPVSTVGNQWLKILYASIDSQHIMKISHCSLRSGKNVAVTIFPCLLKEYNNRWWLIGWNGKSVVNIALETIYAIERSDVVFAEIYEFDSSKYFEDVLGVTMNQNQVETIRLKIAPDSVNYLRTKPIHPSQREENEEGTEITLRLIPNYELQQAILQYGASVEVLEPVSFREAISTILKKAAQNYFN